MMGRTTVGLLVRLLMVCAGDRGAFGAGHYVPSRGEINS
jgi:hypothetical protein